MLNGYYVRKIKIPVTLQFSDLYTDFADWLIALSFSKFVQAVTVLTCIRDASFSNLNQTPIMLRFLWFSIPARNVDIES
jgi:hypothetical protein